jgi:uncharacterized protein YjiS (DUF1127 family)
MWYNPSMSRKEIKEALERVLSWPPERQEDAVRVLAEIEDHDASDYEITREQAAEVEKRLRDPNPRFVALEEVQEHFAQRRA